MSLIKRLSTTLFSRIDQVVGEIENHDALIKAAIAEQRKKIAAAKIQLSRIDSHEKRMRDQAEQLQQDEERWAQRAVKEAQQDEAKALQCMQRRQQARAQMEKSKHAEQEYQQTAEKMKLDIARCEDELKAMSQKHELLRARQSSADALSVVNQAGESSFEELESSFDRWEIKIAQNEMNVESYDNIDVFEQAYVIEVNEASLRVELQELMNKESNDGNA